MTITNEKILTKINDIEDYIVSTRRYLHENPELSAREYNTSAFLKEEALKLNLDIVEVEGTGFYAILDTKRPGKTIGLRTDIDALPIKETAENLKNKRVCISKNDGVFHACGHDGHMAISLGAMQVLTAYKDKLKGRIIFIFEEGEETGSGIRQMIEALKKENIDAIYGNHLASFIETGKVAISPGSVMAGFAMVDFTVRGKGGHGSRPDLSISPIFAATQIINGLASAWANRIDVTKTVTLGLGSIHGGTAPNVIPDEVRITGTLRFLDADEGKKAVELIKKVGSLTAEAHDCEFIANNVSVEHKNVDNDEALAEMATIAINDIMPASVTSDQLWFASESFASYEKVAKTLFSFVGTKNEDLGSGAEHHNEYFDLDEESLKVGVTAMVKFADTFLMTE